MKRDGVVIAPFSLEDQVCDDILAHTFHTLKVLSPQEKWEKLEDGVDTKFRSDCLNPGFARHDCLEICSSPTMTEFALRFCKPQRVLKPGFNILRFHRPEQFYLWHKDFTQPGYPQRLLGFTIILHEPASGGAFQMRKVSTGKITTIEPQKGIIYFFKIGDHDFEHAVLAAEGDPGRISISGCFVDVESEDSVIP